MRWKKKKLSVFGNKMWMLLLSQFSTILFIFYLLITLIVAATGFSSSFNSFKKSIIGDVKLKPPKLLAFFVSHTEDKDGSVSFDYPIRIGLSVYNLIVNAVATLIISLLWPIGLILIAIPYFCFLLYNFGKSRVPIVRHLE